MLIAALGCLWCGADASVLTSGGRTHFDRGRELYALGRWADAREEFAAVCGAVPQTESSLCAEADYYMAMCAMELKEAGAEARLAEFLRRNPESVHVNDVEFALASLLCTAGRYDEAQRAFGKVDYATLSPEHRQQYDIRMGYIRFQQGDYDDALRYFRRIPSPGEYSDHALYYISYIAYVRGDNATARAGFTELSRSAAYGAVAPFYLLQIEFNEGNYRYVVTTGGSLIDRAAGERRTELERIVAEGWFHLGDYGRTEEFLDAYRRSGGEMGRNENYLLGYSLYRQARYDEARPCLQQVCGADDALTQNASYHLADCYLRGGDKQRAMQSFAMAANEAFDAAIAEDALFNYGKLQYELGGGLFNEAIHVLNRYIAQYPTSERAVQARELLIAAYYNSRDYDAAYRAIRSMPTDDADIRAALQKITYFRGLEAYAAGDLAAARRYLEESAAVNVSPKYSALNSFWQGEIAFAEGDYPVAAAKYNAYLRRAPRDAREYAMAWYNLGYCAFDKEEMAQARSSFDKFLQVYAPRDRYRADAWNRLGDVDYAERRFDDAVASYDRAIALATPERHYARYKRAVTLGILGRTGEKQEALRRIIADGEGDYVSEASYELGRSFIAQEQYAEGAAQLERFVADFPASPRRAQALSDLGLAYLNLGDRQKSLHYYDMVVDASPRSSEAREAMQGIREIYVSQGDVDGYFDYAAKAGLEGDLSAQSRDSLSFVAAQNLYLKGNPAAAAQSLRNYVSSYPKGYYLTDALYYLSDCCLRTDDRAGAIETLTRLTEQGTNQYTEQALEKLSELTFAEKRYDEAASAYRRLYDVTTTRSGRETAMTGYVRATVAGGDGDRIAAMAADVCGHADAGATALREAKYAWAGQLRASGDRDRALKLYKELASDVKTREGSEAAYYVIEALFESGDLDKTESEVFAFSDREPNAYWLAKAFLLLGDVYVRKGDTFQARATYQSVADGYSPADDGIVDEAKERIAKLKN